MKLKKLVSAGLVAIMATSLLAGCGGSKDSSETADGKKNLSIFIFANDHESTVYKSMIDQYKKTMQIQLEILMYRLQLRMNIPKH